MLINQEFPFLGILGISEADWKGDARGISGTYQAVGRHLVGGVWGLLGRNTGLHPATLLTTQQRQEMLGQLDPSRHQRKCWPEKKLMLVEYLSVGSSSFLIPWFLLSGISGQDNEKPSWKVICQS